MKLSFQNAGNLLDGIRLLAGDLGITLSDGGADVTVEVSEAEEDALTVSLQGNCATIAYGGGRARFFRGLATLAGWLRDGIQEKEERFTPTFSFNGTMMDMSRNAVMNLPTVKFMMRKMALMGMNAFMLYTEDTYEIEGRPYFGYMRGRYTAEELRELDAYAMTLGIELIPCIQTLGHLATALRWVGTIPRDTADVLLAGEEKTYALIEDMLRTVASIFTSKRVHIGLDETHALGSGQYLDKNGYRPREEIYFEHLGRVAAIAEKYGLSPMMWSDMFFRMAGKGLRGFKEYDPRIVLRDDIGDSIPKNVQQVFWDYYNAEESFYTSGIEQHKKLGEKTMFAGGVWFWSGHCPFFSRSINHTVPALEACRKKGIREVLATVWHNGSESSLILSLAGLALYADYDYRGAYDPDGVARCFLSATGERYADFLKLELPEHPTPDTVACTRALLYGDPLLGFADRHAAGLNTAAYYQKVLAELSPLGEDYAPAFQTVYALTDLLIHKADFGLRLTDAYRKKDRAALSALGEECDTVIEKLDTLRREHRAAWMKYNKPFGWEVHDIRYGGLLSRFETAKMRIEDYLAGRIAAIEELEEERLRVDCFPEESDPFGGQFLWYGYGKYTTAGLL